MARRPRPDSATRARRDPVVRPIIAVALGQLVVSAAQCLRQDNTARTIKGTAVSLWLCVDDDRQRGQARQRVRGRRWLAHRVRLEESDGAPLPLLYPPMGHPLTALAPDGVAHPGDGVRQSPRGRGWKLVCSDDRCAERLDRAHYVHRRPLRGPFRGARRKDARLRRPKSAREKAREAPKGRHVGQARQKIERKEAPRGFLGQTRAW